MPNAGTVNLKLKFVDSNDSEQLLIADYSEWFIVENFPAYIFITLPGASDPITYTFNKHTINSFNSKTLYLGCSECDEGLSDLPDGVYKAKIQSSYEQFSNEAYYLKTDKLRKELNKRYIEIGFQYTDEAKTKIKELFKIEYYINSAKARVAEGYISDAHKFFEEAQKLSSCKNCK